MPTLVYIMASCPTGDKPLSQPMVATDIYMMIEWKHFPCYWPFVRGIHRSPVNSPHKGQWRGALVFSLICAWTNGWANHRDTVDLRRHCAHYDVTVMYMRSSMRTQQHGGHSADNTFPCVSWKTLFLNFDWKFKALPISIQLTTASQLWFR